MSCWVAPAVAAEMWHCAIEQVLEAVRNGTLPSRVEGGFLLVEVAFGGNTEPVTSKRRIPRQAEPALAPPPIEAPPPNRSQEEIVTPQELAALEGRGIGRRGLEDWDSSSEDVQDEAFARTAASEAPDQPQYDMAQLKSIRNQTSRLRRPPV